MRTGARRCAILFPGNGPGNSTGMAITSGKDSSAEDSA
jgi:hypothetical protein